MLTNAQLFVQGNSNLQCLCAQVGKEAGLHAQEFVGV